MKKYKDLDLKTIREKAGIDFAHFTYQKGQNRKNVTPSDLPNRYWRNGEKKTGDDYSYILFKNSDDDRGIVTKNDEIENLTYIEHDNLTETQKDIVVELLMEQLGKEYIVFLPMSQWEDFEIISIDYYTEYLKNDELKNKEEVNSCNGNCGSNCQCANNNHSLETLGYTELSRDGFNHQYSQGGFEGTPKISKILSCNQCSSALPDKINEEKESFTIDYEVVVTWINDDTKLYHTVTYKIINELLKLIKSKINDTAIRNKYIIDTLTTNSQSFLAIRKEMLSIDILNTDFCKEVNKCLKSGIFKSILPTNRVLKVLTTSEFASRLDTEYMTCASYIDEVISIELSAVDEHDKDYTETQQLTSLYDVEFVNATVWCHQEHYVWYELRSTQQLLTFRLDNSKLDDLLYIKHMIYHSMDDLASDSEMLKLH